MAGGVPRGVRRPAIADPARVRALEPPSREGAGLGRTLVELRRASSATTFGPKTAGLSRLARLGFAVSDAWVVPAGAVGEGPEAVTAPAHELAEVLDAESSFAVRSSADVEDTVERSHAGAFCTLLDVDAADVAAAVFEVVESAKGAAAAL